MAVYKIIFKGEITNKTAQTKIEPTLAKLFKISPEKASILFNGKAYALRKGLEIDDAIALQQKLSKIGIVTHLVKEEIIAENITCQEIVTAQTTDIPAGKELDTHASPVKKTVNYLHRFNAFAKTGRGKIIGGVAISIVLTLKLSSGYLADCNSLTTQKSLTRIINNNISKTYPSAKYDLAFSEMNELKYNEASNTYTCQCKVNINHSTGEKEEIDIAYQVIKKFPSAKVALIR